MGTGATRLRKPERMMRRLVGLLIGGGVPEAAFAGEINSYDPATGKYGLMKILSGHRAQERMTAESQGGN